MPASPRTTSTPLSPLRARSTRRPISACSDSRPTSEITPSAPARHRPGPSRSEAGPRADSGRSGIREQSRSVADYAVGGFDPDDAAADAQVLLTENPRRPRWDTSLRRTERRSSTRTGARGSPVVFSHGWPLNADVWDPQLLFMASNGFRAVAHDRRGHGRSSQPWDGNTMDDYADDLAAVIETLDLPRRRARRSLHRRRRSRAVRRPPWLGPRRARSCSSGRSRR